MKVTKLHKYAKIGLIPGDIADLSSFINTAKHLIVKPEDSIPLMPNFATGHDPKPFPFALYPYDILH
jgi:hypothetical protein